MDNIPTTPPIICIKHPAMNPQRRPKWRNIGPLGTELIAAPIRKVPMVNVARASDPPRYFIDNGPTVVNRVLLVKVAAHASASRKIL